MSHPLSIASAALTPLYVHLEWPAITKNHLCNIPGVGGLTWSSHFISSETLPEMCDFIPFQSICCVGFWTADTFGAVPAHHCALLLSSEWCSKPYFLCQVPTSSACWPSAVPVLSQLRVEGSAVLGLRHQTTGSVRRWRMRTGQLCFEGLVALFGAGAPPHTDF